jgi:hypothetical protein
VRLQQAAGAGRIRSDALADVVLAPLLGSPVGPFEDPRARSLALPLSGDDGDQVAAAEVRVGDDRAVVVLDDQRVLAELEVVLAPFGQQVLERVVAGRVLTR